MESSLLHQSVSVFCAQCCRWTRVSLDYPCLLYSITNSCLMPCANAYVVARINSTVEMSATSLCGIRRNWSLAPWRGLQSLYMDTIEKAKKESTLRQPSQSCSCGLRPIDFENIITNIVHHPFSHTTQIPNLLLLFPEERIFPVFVRLYRFIIESIFS